ncbi:death-associated protein kinase 1-like [Oscarella lobularis]|uniref:death-associated protein kinase 1-like n=1 Tax=Oscarella lobularis TaxID=121494 RepID=UPI003313D6DA
MACLGGHLVIATLLVEAGADVNKTDEKGNSVLHFLAIYSQRISDFFLWFDLVKVILLKEPTLIDRSGEDGLLPHETFCLSEVRTILFKEWTNHRYNKLYSQGTTKQTKIKICIIGKAGAGKTTLIKTLKNIHWKDGGDDKRTASMDLSTANIKSAGDVVFCDFAGQPFFHKTHGLFFSESTTAFLLVVDLTESENELKTWSHFFCSFVKCSVVLNEKANFLVVGSKKDLLPSEKIGEIKLRQVFAYVRQNFGRWFNFYEKHFVLNCHDRKSTDLDLLREAIKDVKALTLKAGKEVPIIVEAATASFLPTLRDPFRKGQLFFHKLLSFFTINYLNEEVRQRTLSVIKNHPETKREEVIHFMESSVFEKVMADCLYPGLTVEVQKLLVEFLQGIGEIFVIQNKIILDPTWLCQNIIGPLLCPLNSDFPVSLCCRPPGTTTKEDIQSALEAFNEQKWENIDETIWLLCHLEICYPLPGMRNTYRFPALVEEKRQSEVWCENSEMTVYVGRRVRRAKETDIITPGTMPFLQCHVHNVPSFHGLEPVVWQGGLMIRDTIDGVSVEGMITLQEVDKALDFIVRGPVHSERECVKLLNNLMITGEEVLRKRSPGTDSLLWYISSTELKQLKEFPLAYKEATVDAKIEISAKSSASVSKGMIKDSLKDLLALRDNHIDLLSYKTRCAIITCLDKDDAGRDVLKGHLPGLSEADQVECKTAAELISTWSENLIATAQCFGDAARRSRLPLLLALLSGDGAIELSADENVEAKEDLSFIRTRSLSAIKRRRCEQATQLCSSLSERNDEEISCLFDEIYLDNPPTALEQFRAAERIQPVWRRIGKILGPEPFQFYQLHAFEEKRNDQDRALDMLDAWANKFGKRATRRHFITAMKNVGCSTETIASIFSGQTK